MENHSKKKISADIPFSFLHEMGHNTRAMDRFFELPREAPSRHSNPLPTAARATATDSEFA